MRATIVMIAVVLTAVFASSALAAGNSSAKAAYGKTGAKVQAAIASKPKHAVKKVVPAKKSGILGASATATQTLPFTGLDLGFVAGAGIVLVGMGLSLRRVTRKPPTA